LLADEHLRRHGVLRRQCHFRKVARKRCFNQSRRLGAVATLVPFEVLDVAFVLFCFLERIEGAQVAAFAGGWILLAGIEAEIAGF
jgi:hypothetical protein